MLWPLESKPVNTAGLPYYNQHYLFACSSPSDPTMVWGTDVDATQLRAFIREQNESSLALISIAHVLLRAVGQTLAEFPQLNCRVVRHRIFRFRDTNVRIMTYNRQLGEVDVVIVKNAHKLDLASIARLMWKNQRKSAKRDSVEFRDRQLARQLPMFMYRWCLRAYLWLDRNFRLPRIRLYRVAGAPVLVNYLGFRGAPSMRAYKPSSYPDESSHLSITLGKVEDRPVVRDGEIVIRPIAPLFVRADHRITDAFVLARFIRQLEQRLTDPAAMDCHEECNDRQNVTSHAA